MESNQKNQIPSAELLAVCELGNVSIVVFQLFQDCEIHILYSSMSAEHDELENRLSWLWRQDGIHTKKNPFIGRGTESNYIGYFHFGEIDYLIESSTPVLRVFVLTFCTIYGMVTGSSYSMSHLISGEKDLAGGFGVRMYGQDSYMEDAGQMHSSLCFEQRLVDAIESGNLSLLEHRFLEPKTGAIGKMSRNRIRQEKYVFVSFATLVTRAAIRGGLDQEYAFHLCDDYCMLMDQKEDIESIHVLAYRMAQDFCLKVSEYLNKKYSKKVKVILDYIDRHVYENIRLEQLAKACVTSEKTVATRFKAELGETINAYIHRRKIREAEYLLRDTQQPILAISSQLSYASQSYFTQKFMLYNGLTPQKYRDFCNKNS